MIYPPSIGTDSEYRHRSHLLTFISCLQQAPAEKGVASTPYMLCSARCAQDRNLVKNGEDILPDCCGAGVDSDSGVLLKYRLQQQVHVRDSLLGGKLLQLMPIN